MSSKMLGLFASLLVAMNSAAVAKTGTVGDWTWNWGQGLVEYTTKNDSSDSFELVCGNLGTNHANLGHFIIDGKGPRPNESIDVVVDGKNFRITLGKESHIRTGCRGCAESFNGMWHALRAGKTLEVRFDDGRKATFSLRGSAKVISEQPCEPDFRSVAEQPSVEAKKSTATANVSNETEASSNYMDAAQNCAMIQSDNERLECFDLAFRKSVTTSTPEYSAWRVIKEVSKIDDSQNVHVFVNSRETQTNRYGKSEYLSVNITCRENKTELFIYFAGEFMAGRDDTVSVSDHIESSSDKHARFEEH